LPILAGTAANIIAAVIVAATLKPASANKAGG
jgi:hypothetical protein